MGHDRGAPVALACRPVAAGSLHRRLRHERALCAAGIYRHPVGPEKFVDNFYLQISVARRRRGRASAGHRGACSSSTTSPVARCWCSDKGLAVTWAARCWPTPSLPRRCPRGSAMPTSTITPVRSSPERLPGWAQLVSQPAPQLGTQRSARASRSASPAVHRRQPRRRAAFPRRQEPARCSTDDPAGPARRRHIPEGAGHWVQQERAAEVNRLLIEFLKGL